LQSQRCHSPTQGGQAHETEMDRGSLGGHKREGFGMCLFENGWDLPGLL